MHATPRIAFEDLPAALQDRLRPRVQRLGYLGEFFQVAAHQPDALGYFVDFTEALKAALHPRLVEAIALTVASRAGNAYERVQHERLALEVGFDMAEVQSLVGGDLSSECLAAAERAAAALAREVVAAEGSGCEAAYAALLAETDPATAVACLMTATRYLAHATMANTWGLAPPVSSPLPGEESRA